MTGVDESQLQDQKAHVDKIDPAEINPERRKTPGICDRTRKIHVARSLGSDAIAVHTDGRKESMRRISVTIFASGGNSWHADEIPSNRQGDEVRSCGKTGARTS